MSIFGKKNTALHGVDISSSSIKLIELSKSGSKYKVENYASRPVPENAVVEKNINELEAVGDVIIKMASVLKTKTKDAAVAVAGSAVITKIIEMNASLTDAEMENQIIIEADQYIPYPLDEVAIDFERQGPSPKNEEMVQVLLAACKKENVDLRVAVLEAGGFTAKIVDIEAYAMERAYRLLQEQMDLPKAKLVAIVDIGSTMTTLYILNDGVSIYTREQIFGGAQLSSEIQIRYGIQPNEVEAALKEGNLPEGYEEEVLSPFKEEITEQISRALQFFFSSSQYNDIDLIVLAGGTAATKGLAAQVEEVLSCETIVANPFAKMSLGAKVNKAQLKNDASSLLMACGLAARGFME
ncbi:MAG: pilus assembly protein PilM [SAR86 cluster bacterium]|uniref:Pilus assembly protein PilM n=1 Tax=SAR86 cluster bacterium TaxID=2030880 RepID=A0A2A5CIQ0_9GAMM|nr:pilus assembly protein PilM [Gammaproteobacteria bacterium AH-315-E17]PCJ43749.1 MAG: pilus assembly protein PilM [SAR86 cluster bacterium]